MLEVTVKTLDSQNHSFTLTDEATVLMLKESILNKMEVPLDNQRLIFHGKVLQDDKKLTDYGDVNGKVIHLVQRAPPSNTTRPNDSGRSRATGDGNGGPNRRLYRRLDGGNATYLGALTIPADIVDPQGLFQPSTSQTLSRSRVNAARRMLRMANHTMARLEENADNTASPESPVDTSSSQTNQTERTSPRVEVNVGGNEETFLTMRHHPSSDSPSEPTSSTQNSSNNASDVNVNIDVALEVEVVSDDQNEEQVGSNAETVTENRGNNDSRIPMRIEALAHLFQNLDDANQRLQPLLRQCRDILAADPTYDQNNLANSQRLFNGVSETLHLLAHACHAASDLIVDFNDATPRSLRCRPVIVQHSAILESSIPIQINPINFAPRPPPVPSSTTESTASTSTTTPPAAARPTATASSATTQPTAATSTASAAAHTPSLLTSALTSALAASAAAAAAAAAAATNAATNAAGSINVGAEGNSAGGGPGANIPMGPQAIPIIFGGIGGPFSGPSPQVQHQDNLEIFVNFSSDGPSENVVQAMQAVTNDIIQSRLMRPPGATSQSNDNVNNTSEQNNSTGRNSMPNPFASFSFRGADLPPPPPPPRVTGISRESETGRIPPASAEPNEIAANNGRGNGSPSRDPRQQPRRILHLGNSFHNFLNNRQFDLFLPCSSHHVRAHTNNNNNNNSTVISNRARIYELNISPIDRAEVWRPNSDANQAIRRPGDGQPSASNTRSSQISGNLFLSVLSNILGRWYLYQTSSFPNSNESVADVVRRVGRNSQQINDSLIIELLMTMAQNVRFLDTLAMASSAEGLETLANILRPTLAGFANLRLLSGEPPTQANIARAAERLSNEIRQYLDLGLLTTNRLRETIDLMATINRFNQLHLPQLITLVVESSNETNFGTFGTNLIRQLSIYVRGLLAILVYCCTEGPHDFGVLIRNFITVSTQGAPAEVRNGAEQYLMDNLRDFFAQLDVSGDRLQRYLVYRAPPVQEPMETDAPAPEAGAWNAQDTIASPQKVEEPMTDVVAMETESLPEILIGSEPWHNALPSEWVPVIARDVQRQRQRRPPTGTGGSGTDGNVVKPLSDAYLAGMPPKRRKLLASATGRTHVHNLPLSISEGIREAIRASGVTPATASLERIVTAAGEDSGLQRAYRQQQKVAGTRIIRSDPDFTPTRFPNAYKYFK